MYTLHGLKLIAENKSEAVPVGYLKDALWNLQDALEAAEKMSRLLSETFGKKVPVDVSLLMKKMQQYEDWVSTQSEVTKEQFVEVYEWAADVAQKEQAFAALLDEQFEQIRFQKLEPTYFVLNANSLAVHKLGLFQYKEDHFITVHYESDDYYMGAFWDSNFFNVKFAKGDVRELTENEKRHEHIV